MYLTHPPGYFPTTAKAENNRKKQVRVLFNRSEKLYNLFVISLKGKEQIT